jgi:hypothetical protein
MIDTSPLKVGESWIDIEVLGDSDVVLTFKGYVPILPVRVLHSGLSKFLYIGAKSISTQLEALRKDNGGGFKGLSIRIRKESSDKFSPYIIEKLT